MRAAAEKRASLDTLRIWPTAMEANIARKWYLVILIPVGFFFITGLLRHPSKEILSPLLDPYFSSLALALFVSGIALASWESRARRVFQSLIDTDLIQPRKAGADAGTVLLARYERNVRKPARHLTVGVFVAFTLTWFLRFGVFSWAFAHLRSCQGSMISKVELAGEGATLLVWTYAAAAAGWSIYAHGLTISGFWKDFDLNVSLGHPDKCGGWQQISSSCLLSVAPLICGVVLLGLWSSPKFAAYVPGVYGVELAWIQQLSAVAVLLLLVLTTFAFFKPLWSIHLSMERQRDEYTKKFASILRIELAKLQAVLSAPSATAADHVKELNDRMKLVQTLDPDTVNFPAWPFDRSTVYKLVVPQALALLPTLLKLVKGA